MQRVRLGDLLLEMGMISQEQLNEVLEEQKQTKEKFGELLIRKKMLTEEQLIEVLEFQLGIPHINLFRFPLDPSIVRLIPEALARRYVALAVKKDKNHLMVAMADPMDFYAIEDLRMSTGFVIDPVIASRADILTFIERVYTIQETVDELRSLVPKEEELEQEVTNEESPVVRLVNQIIDQAVQQRVSDIHIDPEENEVLVRYRIDGILQTQQSLPKYMQGMITARIKIMSDLNIAERRLPQDGRIQFENGLQTIDIRVSTLPTVNGEKCVMRLLDARNAVIDLNRLGLSTENLAHFQSMITASHGIVLITGPTGSGKTSTLYAALKTVATSERNVITVEDPVEYRLAGVNQVQVSQSIGMSFARGLRSILRQDPDIIMVGEIRDGETAEVAVRAALTGHLVFSTLHTNDAISTITRLMDMGIEPFLVASSVVGVVAQRLVRRVCDQCAQRYTPTATEAAWLSQHDFSVEHLMRGRGCGYCGKTGYRGRIAVHEVVKLDETMRSLIVSRQSERELREYVRNQRFSSMQEDGLQKAASGITTVEEIMRVTMRE